MTWTELKHGLATVATTGSTQSLSPEVAAKLHALGMIEGSEGDDSGVTLTVIGRHWMTPDEGVTAGMEVVGKVIGRIVPAGRE